MHNTQPDCFRIIIIGGGVAGLTLANALQHAGIDYVLLEARREICPQIGASIGLFPHGLRILDQMGCFDDIAAASVPMVFFDNRYETGELSPLDDSLQLQTARFTYPATFLERSKFLQVLYDKLLLKDNILVGKRLASIVDRDDNVTVHCDDGSIYSGDVVIGADGIFSATRQEMWRLADEREPGRISVEDKTATTAEYQCMFGISPLIKVLSDKGHIHVTHNKDISSLVCTSDRVYWFIFKKLDKVYTTGKIPRFSKQDAIDFAEIYAHHNILPKGAATLHDLHKCAIACNLVALEEAEFKTWTFGRVACLGDSIHKMTPNAGHGGNATIESAAALANCLKRLHDKQSGEHPSLAQVTECLTAYQQSREKRASAVMKDANLVTRIHAMKSLPYRILAHHIAPMIGSIFEDMVAETIAGATMIDYLPPPPRSVTGIMPFNPSHGLGKRESIFWRAFLASPLLVMTFIAAYVLNAAPAMPSALDVLKSGEIRWTLGAVPLRGAFYHVEWLDNIFRSVFVFFAPSLYGYDAMSSWQMVTFLTDFGLIYSIYVIESGRRANAFTFMRIPIVFALMAQLRGIGVISSVIYFLHYTSSQIQNFGSTDMRLTDMSYTTGVGPAMLLGYYIPLYASYLHPSLSIRQDWNWFWQLYPIWISLIQRLLAYTVTPNTLKQDRLTSPLRDLRTIRITVGAFIALSGGVWLWAILAAPFSIKSIMIPIALPNFLVADLAAFARSFLQWDQVFLVFNSFIWLAYMFWDLKHAGMIANGWLTIMAFGVAATIVLGPGAAIGLGWLWREETLAYKRHKDAVTSTWAKAETTMDQRVNSNGWASKE